jgi:hypothetical protein
MELHNTRDTQLQAYFTSFRRVSESLEAARQNFRAKLRAAFGAEEGAANPSPTETGP